MRDIICSHECSHEVGEGSSFPAVRSEQKRIHASLPREMELLEDLQVLGHRVGFYELWEKNSHSGKETSE